MSNYGVMSLKPVLQVHCTRVHDKVQRQWSANEAPCMIETIFRIRRCKIKSSEFAMEDVRKGSKFQDMRRKANLASVKGPARVKYVGRVRN